MLYHVRYDCFKNELNFNYKCKTMKPLKKF